MQHIVGIMDSDDVTQLAVFKVLGNEDARGKGAGVKDAEREELEDLKTFCILHLLAFLGMSFFPFFVKTCVLEVHIIKRDQACLGREK